MGSLTLEPAEARRYLVGHLGLARPAYGRGGKGVRTLLERLRCIQLDPLDALGTNADLVAMARVDGLARGDVYRHLLPGHAFEHYAKERCLLPASAFAYYRDHVKHAPRWGVTERLRRLPPGVTERVLAEIAARGPLTAAELGDHGAVVPIRASERRQERTPGAEASPASPGGRWGRGPPPRTTGGWVGTARAGAMALEVLASRCEVVVAGRTTRGKRYDLPERALGPVASAPGGDFARWALLERVEAAGLLPKNAGPHWSLLEHARAAITSKLLHEEAIDEVVVAGSPRRYLAPRGFAKRRQPAPDARLRLLGPLDPLLWDRALVKHAFGFEYVWEVYKPAAQRRWGWYVVPLLHRGELVGRMEARVADGVLRVDNLWRERGKKLDDAALDEALARHAAACGASQVKRPARARAS